MTRHTPIAAARCNICGVGLSECDALPCDTPLCPLSDFGVTASPVVPQLPEGAVTPQSLNILRAAGEAYDADQITPPCNECGLSEYTCTCEADDWFTTPSPMSLEEANARIAAAFAPLTGWSLAEHSAYGMSK